MLVNFNKTIMYMWGKVVQNDNLKRHVSSKHGNTESTVQFEEGRQQHGNLVVIKHYDKVQVEGSEIEVSDDLPVNDGPI